MDYLKKFNLTDNDLLELKEQIDDMDKIFISMHKDKVNNIIELLKTKKLNIKDILLYRFDIFYEEEERIKKILDNVDEKTLNEIREDITKLELIGL